jgi:hypothetical protein
VESPYKTGGIELLQQEDLGRAISKKGNQTKKDENASQFRKGL